MRPSLLLFGLTSAASSTCFWRQTGGCDPSGPREPSSDLACADTVRPGASGYCECEGGRRTAHSTCEHDPLVCETECKKTRKNSGSCAGGLDPLPDGTCVNPATPTQQSTPATAMKNAMNNKKEAPASAKPAPAAAPPVAQGFRCQAWRQTHACDANGRRDRKGDKGCDETVPSGASGFCECAGMVDGTTRRVRLSSCDHMPFTCQAECARAIHYDCDGWRQTGNCTADGPREEDRDKTCEESVPGGVSGYCECAGGARRVARPPGCKVDEPAETCFSVCARGESLYQMLGVHDGAPESLVKKEFRKISLKLHPDKQRTAESKQNAAARFAEVRAAYDVLSDPDARILYDMHGYEAANDKGNKQREQGNNLEVTISLKEAYTGGDKSMKISRRVVCKGCSTELGSMANTPRCRKCGECPPEVKPVNVQLGPMVIQQQQEVPSKERCIQEEYDLEYTVKRGASDGDKISFARAGEQRPGRIPGDVTLVLKVASDGPIQIQRSGIGEDGGGQWHASAGWAKPAKVKRKGSKDLQTDVHISLQEAMLGWSRTITHLDGHTVKVERKDTVTPPGAVVRIAGEGLVQTDEDGAVVATGVLLVVVTVDFPASLSEEAKKWAREVLPP